MSLIVAVYNRPLALEMIFASLVHQTFADFEVLVADDGSGPQIRDVIARYQPKLRLPIVHVRHEHDGFRKTIIVNKAASLAAAPYLVFVDGDCILHHRFLERHFRRRSLGAVLSGRRVELSPAFTARLSIEDVQSRNLESPLFWWRGASEKARRRGLYLPFVFRARKLLDKRYRILGCNFSLHKSAFCSVNGYDERILGRGMEDSNLNERLLLRGCSVYCIAGEALQYHLYHDFDPIPHSPETVRLFCNPDCAWTPHGMKKQLDPSALQGRV
jgi:glycosyltransferase involved in cell wall biosynthesis